MTASEIRKKYLEFFKSKGHAIVPSSPLVPENDPSTLFTGSGMQPMVPYLLGEKHPLGARIADAQKCFRAQDIEEVGDNRHTTFFEMLGNWSFGDYFKEEQIRWMFEFLTKEIGLDPNNLYITVFRGNEESGISRDNEAVALWKEEFRKAGIEARDVDFAERDGMQGGRIFYYPESKNWWSRSGVPANMPVGEPGGPDSEMFWDFGTDRKLHENSSFKDGPCHVNCDCGRFVEIGNNVFMQYVKTGKGFEQLPKGNIDFGGGLERLAAASLNEPDIFKTDLFAEILSMLESLSGKKYEDGAYSMRVIADHLKVATFLIADGVLPSNTERGYVLRRLIRRAVRYGKQIGIAGGLWTKDIAQIVIREYSEIYPQLEEKSGIIREEINKEEEKFARTLEQGERVLEKMFAKAGGRRISGKEAFDLFQTYGLPLEMTEELAKEKGFAVDMDSAREEFKKHQELSRTASAGMFKGGLADASEETKKLHTAAHLMLAALRKVLGDHVVQRGSNITSERLRFDFSHPEKMSAEQISEVERLVNEAIGKKLPVSWEEMPIEEAKEKGAMGVFESKYGERVKVYTAGIGDDIVSKEICGGPHVENTGELGRFKIQKEESSSSGVRRIKAVLEK